MITAAQTSAPDPETFYLAFSPLCFTLLGLWLIVVQTRYSEWRGSAVHRSRAYTLAIDFALPGLMALIALVDPANSTLWRAGFAFVAIVAVVALIGLIIKGPGRGEHPAVSLIAGWVAIILYGLICLLALAPGLVDGVGLTVLQVEEILLSLLVFTTVTVAWLLMFDQVDGDAEPHNQDER